MKLLEKFNQIKSAMALKLDEAEGFLTDGKMDEYNKAREDYAKLETTAKAYKEQIDSQKAYDKLNVAEDETPEPEVTKAARLPFESTEPAKETEEDEGDIVAKAVNILRYGETDDKLKVIMTDIYGRGYEEKRAAQKAAFSKYLKFGNERLSAKEAGSLRELVLTPQSIEYDVKDGLGVSDIKANKTVQQEGALELGGALVPEDWRADLIARMSGTTIVRRFARQITTTRDRIEWPKLLGGDELHSSAVRVTWVDEVPSAADVAQTNFTLGTTSIPIYTVMARLDVSRNLLEDSAIDVPMLVNDLFAEEMALDEDNQFLTGVGAGRPYGILGARDGAAYSPVDGVGSVATGAASTLTADGVIDLSYEPDMQYLQNAVFIGNKTTFRALRKLKDGNSDYLWSRGLAAGAPPNILGYSYYMNQNMPAIAAGSYPLIFGDLRGYMIADRVGMTVERIQDTDTVGKNKVAIFARRRLGGSVIYPWMLKVQKVSA